MIGQRRLAIGTFSNHQEAELALGELRASGFKMDQISIIGNDVERDANYGGAQQGNKLSDVENKPTASVAKGAVTGGAAGGLTGLLIGLGLVAIPGLGPVVLAGAAATAIATTLTGGAIGATAGGLLGGLVGLGIAEDRAQVYSDRFAQGDYVVIVEGTSQEILLAESIFKGHSIYEWGIYDSSNL